MDAPLVGANQVLCRAPGFVLLCVDLGGFTSAFHVLPLGQLDMNSIREGRGQPRPRDADTSADDNRWYFGRIYATVDRMAADTEGLCDLINTESQRAGHVNSG